MSDSAAGYDDYMTSREPVEGAETIEVVPLSRTVFQWPSAGDDLVRRSVVRHARVRLDELADEIREVTRGLVEDGKVGKWVSGQLFDIAEQAERIGREAMDGTDEQGEAT